MYHFRKGSKLLSNNGTISEEGQTSSTKMVPFQKRVKNPQQKWYNFRKGSKILNRNGTISENGQYSSTKMVLFPEKGQNSSKNGPISEKGQNSSTKMVTFQKTVKVHQQKWYHFRNK